MGLIPHIIEQATNKLMGWPPGDITADTILSWLCGRVCVSLAHERPEAGAAGLENGPSIGFAAGLVFCAALV